MGRACDIEYSHGFMTFPLLSLADESCDGETVLKEATQLLQTKFEVFISTIQVERYIEDMSVCPQCQDPTG